MQYKLIKSYPNCQAELGQVLNQNGPYYENILLENHVHLYKDEVENNPEFWEKLYPIGAKLIDTDGYITNIHLEKDGKWWGADSNETVRYINNKDIGDGKRFQVIEEKSSLLNTTEDGAEIYSNDTKLFEVILDTLHLNENIPYIACNDINDKRGDGYASKIFSTKQAALDYISKNKVLFTTEDGVDIKKHELYYTVYNNIILSHIAKLNLTHFSIPKRFSTKEKAEEYLLYNKPCLSFNDLLKIPSLQIIYAELLQITKEKLGIKE